MKALFLSRLLRYSRTGFVIVILFLGLYILLYSKKMSMMLFPYNAMYSVDFYHNTKGSVYAMKVDGKIIPITQKWYWKKDFLETSLRGFGHYISDSGRVYMDHYIPHAFHNPNVQKHLLQTLSPGKIEEQKWAEWFAEFAGVSVSNHSLFELYNYNYEITKDGFQLKDSVKIWSSENE